MKMLKNFRSGATHISELSGVEDVEVRLASGSLEACVLNSRKIDDNSVLNGDNDPSVV